jgi:hypothetical protein
MKSTRLTQSILILFLILNSEVYSLNTKTRINKPWGIFNRGKNKDDSKYEEDDIQEKLIPGNKPPVIKHERLKELKEIIKLRDLENDSENDGFSLSEDKEYELELKQYFPEEEDPFTETVHVPITASQILSAIDAEVTMPLEDIFELFKIEVEWFDTEDIIQMVDDEDDVIDTNLSYLLEHFELKVKDKLIDSYLLDFLKINFNIPNSRNDELYKILNDPNGLNWERVTAQINKQDKEKEENPVVVNKNDKIEDKFDRIIFIKSFLLRLNSNIPSDISGLINKKFNKESNECFEKIGGIYGKTLKSVKNEYNLKEYAERENSHLGYAAQLISTKEEKKILQKFQESGNFRAACEYYIKLLYNQQDEYIKQNEHTKFVRKIIDIIIPSRNDIIDLKKIRGILQCTEEDKHEECNFKKNLNNYLLYVKNPTADHLRRVKGYFLHKKYIQTQIYRYSPNPKSYDCHNLPEERLDIHLQTKILHYVVAGIELLRKHYKTLIECVVGDPIVKIATLLLQHAMKWLIAKAISLITSFTLTVILASINFGLLIYFTYKAFASKDWATRSGYLGDVAAMVIRYILVIISDGATEININPVSFSYNKLLNKNKLRY